MRLSLKIQSINNLKNLNKFPVSEVLDNLDHLVLVKGLTPLLIGL